jgi:hypothetical protein
MSASPWWTWILEISMLPLYAVWLAGIVVALARWGKHPGVSALVATSLAGMFLIYLAQRLGSQYIIVNARTGGQPVASIGIYLGILGVAATLLRAGAWAGILVAVFGWRRSRQDVAAAPFQFSIRGLMILTLAAALLCGLLRGLISWLGESALFLLSLIDDIPVMVCWIVGLRLAIVRWPAHLEVSKFAILGFGLSLGALVVWQALWMALAVTQSSAPIRLLALPVTLVSTAAWVLLLIAAFGWREAGAGSSVQPR